MKQYKIKAIKHDSIEKHPALLDLLSYQHTQEELQKNNKIITTIDNLNDIRSFFFREGYLEGIKHARKEIKTWNLNK